jgi:hydrogenase small subunit
LGKVIRPPVIWLHFQDCTGCTESLLQTSHPGFADLILNVISLEYHETLMAGSGLQARQALDEAVTEIRRQSTFWSSKAPSQRRTKAST